MKWFKLLEVPVALLVCWAWYNLGDTFHALRATHFAGIEIAHIIGWGLLMLLAAALALFVWLANSIHESDLEMGGAGPHHTLVMLAPETDIPIKKLFDILAEDFGRENCLLVDKTITVQVDTYRLDVLYAEGPRVLQESEAIAKEHGEYHPHRDRIALCDRRFEIVGEKDPDARHYSDYCLVLGSFMDLGKTYVFNNISKDLEDSEDDSPTEPSPQSSN